MATMRVSDSFTIGKLPQLVIHVTYVLLILPFLKPKYNTIRHFCGIPPLKRTLFQTNTIEVLDDVRWAGRHRVMETDNTWNSPYVNKYISRDGPQFNLPGAVAE
jgi:hypothetical protein